MKISYQWLKEYVEFRFPPAELAQQLTMLGLEVEGLDKQGDDTVLEINVTANRGDCLSYIGIAREVALLPGCTLKLPSQTAALLASHPNKTGDRQVEITDSKLCPRYTASIIKGIKVAPSPTWLVERMEKAGLRSLNNIVDITNYVLMEWGQPLHAFDLALLEGNKIIVRPAHNGESFSALDGKQYTLDEKMLLICDSQKAVALGGVMGGLNSVVNDDTCDILLECAYFNPNAVRYTSRKLGLNTESSYRFARDVDGANLLAPLKHALQLIKELAGGTLVEPIIDNYPVPLPAKQIKLRHQRVNHILGTKLTPAEITGLIKRLHFDVIQEDQTEITVQVPTFRAEIEREIDLIEEIVRLYGYKNTPVTLPTGKISEIILNPNRRLNDVTHYYLTSCGFWEAINFSFTSQSFCSRLKLDSKMLKLSNPLNQELEVLRDSLLPGLLTNVIYNLNRQTSDLKLYEIGRCYYASNNALPDEKNRLGIILTGKRNVPSWYSGKHEVDFYDLKGIVEGLLGFLKSTEWTWERGNAPYLHPGQSAMLNIGGQKIGQGGRLHPNIQQELGLLQQVFYWELDLDEVFERMPKPGKVTSLPRYPAVYRDLAIVIDEKIPVVEVEKVISKNRGNYLKEFYLFDVYSGNQLTKGKKSLAFALVYQWDEGTLLEEQINQSQEQIVKALMLDLNAMLR